MPSDALTNLLTRFIVCPPFLWILRIAIRSCEDTIARFCGNHKDGVATCDATFLSNSPQPRSDASREVRPGRVLSSTGAAAILKLAEQALRSLDGARRDDAQPRTARGRVRPRQVIRIATQSRSAPSCPLPHQEHPPDPVLIGRTDEQQVVACIEDARFVHEAQAVAQLAVCGKPQLRGGARRCTPSHVRRCVA
jgi:hypothetical protein